MSKRGRRLRSRAEFDREVDRISEREGSGTISTEGREYAGRRMERKDQKSLWKEFAPPERSWDVRVEALWDQDDSFWRVD